MRSSCVFQGIVGEGRSAFLEKWSHALGEFSARRNERHGTQLTSPSASCRIESGKSDSVAIGLEAAAVDFFVSHANELDATLIVIKSDAPLPGLASWQEYALSGAVGGTSRAYDSLREFLGDSDYWSAAEQKPTVVIFVANCSADSLDFKKMVQRVGLRLVIIQPELGARPEWLERTRRYPERLVLIRAPLIAEELGLLVRNQLSVAPPTEPKVAVPLSEELVMAARDFLYLADDDGQVRYVSPNFPLRYLRTLSDWNDVYRDAAKPVEEREREGVPFVIEMPTHDGTLMQLELVESRAPEAIGGGWVGVGRDITERALMESESRRAQKLESLGRLAGGLAHDLNDLLTVIGGEADMLAGGAAAESAKVILETTERAADLGRSLMLFGLESTTQHAPVDLSEMARDALRLFGRMLPESINIELDLGAQGKVLASPTDLSTALMNLLVNAADSMPDGGRLRVTTADLESDSKFAPVIDGQAMPAVALSIEDSGEGMGAEVKERMFDPFYSTRGAGGGKGLGLAVVQGVTKRLGGSTHVYSELCVGTRIDLVFPRERSEKNYGAEAGDAHGEGELILLVEDDERVRSLTTRVLQRSGFRVLALGVPTEALELDDNVLSSVAMMVSDVIMPRLSGPELYEKLLALSLIHI